MERGGFLKNNGGDGSQVTMALSAVVSDHNSAIVDGIDGKFVFIEIGVGFNTPTIIRFPFEQMTYNNDDAVLIRLNLDYPQAIEENKDKTISFEEDVEEILDYWLSRI